MLDFTQIITQIQSFTSERVHAQPQIIDHMADIRIRGRCEQAEAAIGARQPTAEPVCLQPAV